ncbi:hypothetical protein DZA65_00789 [Dickeya dianthicola]|nr:hypothetical protein DZA65_00789 [Dickeya dianthicola]
MTLKDSASTTFSPGSASGLTHCVEQDGRTVNQSGPVHALANLSARRAKKRGFADERHLWPSFYRLISQCKPPVIFGEQVASKDIDVWIDLVQIDVEKMGYAFGCVPFPAASLGAPNIRERAYWVAYSKDLQKWAPKGESEQSNQKQGEIRGCNIPHPAKSGNPVSYWRNCVWVRGANGRLFPVESGTLPLVDGDTKRVGRISAYGNAINAEAAKAFIEAAADYMSAYSLGVCE